MQVLGRRCFCLRFDESLATLASNQNKNISNLKIFTEITQIIRCNCKSKSKEVTTTKSTHKEHKKGRFDDRRSKHGLQAERQNQDKSLGLFRNYKNFNFTH